MRYSESTRQPARVAEERSGVNAPVFVRFWRHGVLVLMVVAPLVFLLARKPFGQDPQFHNFADQRTFFSVPNFLDVSSNLPFLFVGVAGLWLWRRNRVAGASTAWTIFFAGVALVSLGSAYYHWRPCNETLVWDRLPMTVAFMAMSVALLNEFISQKLGRFLLIPALLLGFSSVLYWHWSDDLRFYRWLQMIPLLMTPVVMVLFKTRYTHQLLLLLALGCYALAKVSEAHDPDIFAFTNGAVGGHAVKHLLAAAGCFVLLEMLRRRRPVLQWTPT